jgi:hypothetical protein
MLNATEICRFGSQTPGAHSLNAEALKSKAGRLEVSPAADVEAVLVADPDGVLIGPLGDVAGEAADVFHRFSSAFYSNNSCFF